MRLSGVVLCAVAYATAVFSKDCESKSEIGNLCRSDSVQGLPISPAGMASVLSIEHLDFDKALCIVKKFEKNGLTPFISKVGRLLVISVPDSQKEQANKILEQEMKKNKNLAEHEITPSARCSPPNRSGMFISAEALYWNASQDNMLFTLDFGVDPDSGPGVVPTHALAISQDFPWSWGARAKIGYKTPYNGWDLTGEWTYLFSKKTKRVHSNESSLVLVLESPGQTSVNDTATSIRSTWIFSLQMADLLLSREFFISKQLVFKPSAGLKAAWPHQHWHVAYQGVTPDPADASSTSVRSTNRFWGVGPRMGFLSRWKLPARFGVDFDLSASFLFSKFKSIALYGGFIGGSSPLPSRDFPLVNRVHALVPQVQMNAGIDWSICYDKYRAFAFYLGYEFEYWWNAYKVVTFSNPWPSSSLMIHGATSGVRFDF